MMMMMMMMMIVETELQSLLSHEYKCSVIDGISVIAVSDLYSDSGTIFVDIAPTVFV